MSCAASFAPLPLLVLLLLSLLPHHHALLTFPNIIDSYMVLQRAPQSARIWGTSDPSATLSVTIPTLTPPLLLHVIADATTGAFEVLLPPTPASSPPHHTVTISTSSSSLNESRTFHSVAFGDVYLCSGQSNMELNIANAFAADETIRDSVNYPDLRLFTINKTVADRPLNDSFSRFPASLGSSWLPSSPLSTNNSWVDEVHHKSHSPSQPAPPQTALLPLVDTPLTPPPSPSLVVCAPQVFTFYGYFSAVCYHSGVSLYTTLQQSGQQVPIGLIETCWSGTRIQVWMSPEALSRECPASSSALLPSPSPSTVVGAPVPSNETVLWNAMWSAIVPFRISGVLWYTTHHTRTHAHNHHHTTPHTPPTSATRTNAHSDRCCARGLPLRYQGESNAGNPLQYACLQTAFILDLRVKYEYARLSFHFVLLAAFTPHSQGGWPEFRQAQLSTLDVPFTGYASAIDLGDPASPYGGVHSRYKQEVGQRMARSIAAVNYRLPIQWQGPIMADIVWPLPPASPRATVLVRYDPTHPANLGLHVNDTKECDDCCQRGSAFSVVMTGGRMVVANRTEVYAEEGVVVVQVDVPTGLEVTGLQHAWEMYPQCVMHNGDSLVQAPFQVMRYAHQALAAQ